MEQKHFMDISRIKEDTELTQANTNGFLKGDHIVIQIKFDGSNAAIRYDKENDGLVAFSRYHELDFQNTLSGFWNYVQSLDKEEFEKYPNYVFFGEWAVKNKIIYKQEYRKIWIMYDVYDVEKQEYLSQDRVKELAAEVGVPYIHVLYDGEFVSWDHCRSFMNNVVYSESIEEGIVVKSQSNLNCRRSRDPFVLKIVNDKFSEVMKHQPKIVDPEVEAAKANAKNIVMQIVTERRIEKEIYKMRDEGILPEKINPEDMKLVARNLPKRIYEDCVKEEPEMVKAAGEYFNKTCSATTMNIARKIIMGN